MVSTTTDNSEPVTPEPTTKAGLNKWLAAAIITLLLAGGAGAYWWRDQKAKSDQKKLDSEITTLKQQVSDLEKKLAAKPAETKVKPSQDTLDNIAASISSGNTAALAGYMASTVTVTIAASEGVGPRTPTQAIADLAYLDAGTDPWDFDLPAATIAGYADGSYSQYFPDGALVGKSANDYVVSFLFDDAGKINAIFMAVNADLL